MNFNELYSRKNKQRPKRNDEEKRNLLKIPLGLLAGAVVGAVTALIFLAIYNLFF